MQTTECQQPETDYKNSLKDLPPQPRIEGMKWTLGILACAVCLSIGVNLGQWMANQPNKGKTSYCVSYYGESGARRGFNWYEITTDKPMRQAVDIANLIEGLKKYEPGSSNVVPICIFKFDK